MRLLVNERKEYRRIMDSIIYNEICITPELPPKGFADGEHTFCEEFKNGKE